MTGSPVQPIPHEEDCYFVQSRSRPEIKHRVEVEGKNQNRTYNCGCERVQARGEADCYHCQIVRAYEQGYEDACGDCYGYKPFDIWQNKK